jgi:hypothetical protein
MALLLLIIILVPIILALREAVRQPRKRKLAAVLIGILVVGAADFALHVYYLARRDCGATYNSDIGCLDALPSWLALIGFIALLVAIMLSIVIIFMPPRNRNTN